MKKLLLILCLIQIYSISGFTQTAQSCPNIKIIAPSGLTLPGESAIFAVEPFDFPDSSNAQIKYEWSVSLGNIAEGNGTPIIRVLTTNDMSGAKLVATVKVFGLPSNCTSNANAVAEIAPLCGLPEKMDQYNSIPFAKERPRLELIVSRLVNNKEMGVVFVTWRSKTQSQVGLKRRIERMRNYLSVTKGIDKARIKFVDGGVSRVSYTDVYLIPLSMNLSDIGVGANNNPN